MTGIHTDIVAVRRSRSLTPVAVVYLTLAVAGLVGTWYFNLTYTGPNYVADWFANAASSSAALDLIVIVAVAATFYVRESRRLRWHLWIPALFTVVSIAIAVSFALPLFLALRELRAAPPAPPPRDRPISTPPDW